MVKKNAASYLEFIWCNFLNHKNLKFCKMYSRVDRKNRFQEKTDRLSVQIMCICIIDLQVKFGSGTSIFTFAPTGLKFNKKMEKGLFWDI